MPDNAIVTEADILTEIVMPDQPNLNREVARSILALRFNEHATGRIRELLQKNNAGTITSNEKSILEKYTLVGQFLDLMQAKARLSHQGNDSGPSRTSAARHN